MITCHTNGVFNQNTWIYKNPVTNQSLIVDPGDDTKTLFELIADTEISHILVTHGHPDHIQGLGETKKRYPHAVIVAHENAMHTFSNADYNLSHYMNMEIYAPNPDHTFSGEQALMNIIGQEWHLIYTPGHAIDHVCFYNPIEQFIFVGDMIFDQESMKTATISSGDPSFPDSVKFTIGRTDFPFGCDPKQMRQSILKLLELPKNTLVYSGHGQPFMIEEAQKAIKQLISEQLITG